MDNKNLALARFVRQLLLTQRPRLTRHEVKNLQEQAGLKYDVGFDRIWRRYQEEQKRAVLTHFRTLFQDPEDSNQRLLVFSVQATYGNIVGPISDQSSYLLAEAV